MHKKLLAATLVAFTGGTILTTTATQQSPAQAADTVRASTPIFAGDSFWYRTLPTDAPVDTQSSTRMSNIINSNMRATGANSMRDMLAGISTTEYTPPTWIASNSDPVATLQWVNCQGLDASTGPKLLSNLGTVRIPTQAVPADGSDAEMTIYNKDTKQYTDLWRVKKVNSTTYQFCAGGTLQDASKEQGVFGRDYGTTGSGLAMWGGMVKADELRRGEINHVVAISLPVEVVNALPVGMATRSDGNATEGRLLGMQEGQYMRLPANLNIDAMNLNRTQKIFAKAAQKYGFVLWDRASVMSFRAENTKSIGSDPYVYGEQLFGGNGYGGWDVLMGGWDKKTDPFPWDKMQVLSAGYVPPASTSTPTPTTPPPTTTPTPTPTPTPTVPTAYSVTGSGTSTSFSFKANALPPQGKMVLRWKMSGREQMTTTTSTTWSSGKKKGYTDAYAVLVDAHGGEVARSNTLNPTTLRR